MKQEIQSAANFLVDLLTSSAHNLVIGERQLESFKVAVVKVLRQRYRGHWFPENPFKGSGYRCIRINTKMDPIIAQAVEMCGLSSDLIHQAFPSELTVWIDPREVSYRIGDESGNICMLYEHKSNEKEGLDTQSCKPWKPNSSNSTAMTDNTITMFGETIWSTEL